MKNYNITILLKKKKTIKNNKHRTRIDISPKNICKWILTHEKTLNSTIRERKMKITMKRHLTCIRMVTTQKRRERKRMAGGRRGEGEGE